MRYAQTIRRYAVICLLTAAFLVASTKQANASVTSTVSHQTVGAFFAVENFFTRLFGLKSPSIVQLAIHTPTMDGSGTEAAAASILPSESPATTMITKFIAVTGRMPVTANGTTPPFGCWIGFRYSISSGEPCLSSIGLSATQVIALIKQYTVTQTSSPQLITIDGGSANGPDNADLQDINHSIQTISTTVANLSNEIGGVASSAFSTTSANSWLAAKTIGAGNGGTGSTTLSGLLLGNGAGALNSANLSGLSLIGTTLANPNIIGSGTQGQLPFYNAAGTVLTATSSIFLSPSGYVGIGTSSPTKVLTIDSSSVNGTTIRISNSSAGGRMYDFLQTGSANTGGAGRLDIFDATAGLARLSVAANGNIGIGTTNPTALLTVAGSSSISGTLTANALSLATSLSVANGGTGATTTVGALSNLGLSFASSNQVNSNSIGTWGDSLTSGGEDGTGISYPNQLAVDLPGTTVYNGGVGGQTSTQIGVREGGIADTVSVSGGQIPASGGVSVTFPTGYEPVTSQGPSSGIYGTISGVYGLVTLSGTTYTFTRSTSGSIVTVLGPVPFTVDTMGHNNGFVIIWAGRNDSSSPSQVEASIASMVASLPSPKTFLILGILNGSGEGSGTTAYNNIAGINNYLAATYPNNYLDIRAYLVSQYNPSLPQDVTDYGNDIPPTSLRFDAIHLNAAGYTLIAQQIANWITSYNQTHGGIVTSSNLSALLAQPTFGLTTISSGSATSSLDVKAAIGTTSFTGASHLNVTLEGLSSEYTGIDFVNNGGAGLTYPKARIAMTEDSSGSYLSFGTTANWSAGITNRALTITPQGYVDIGTSTSLARLSITGDGTSANSGMLRLDNGGGSGGVGIKLVSYSANVASNDSISTGFTGGFEFNTSVGVTIAKNASNNPYASTNLLSVAGSMAIGSTYGNGTVSAPTSGLVVEGSVGIGTSSPYASALHVYNAVNGNSYIAMDGTSTYNIGYQIRRNNVLKWQLFSDGNDSFNVYDGTNKIVSIARGAPANTLLVGSSGNVGIGTTSPASTLTVTGSACISRGSGATAACSTTAGTITANVFNTAAADLAERYSVTDSSIVAGDIVALDPSQSLVVDKAVQGQTPFGIISSDPGFLLGETNLDASSTLPVALAGRVPVNVSVENGVISIGDLLTLSSTPGIAMKATDPSMPVIGTALEGASANGSILGFVHTSFTSSLSAALTAKSTPQSNSGVLSFFQGLGVTIAQDVATFKNIIADHIIAGTVTVTNGIEIKDRDTGIIYCTYLASGTWQKTAGSCDSQPIGTSSGGTTGGSSGGNGSTSTTTESTGRTTDTTGTTTDPVTASPIATTTEPVLMAIPPAASTTPSVLSPTPSTADGSDGTTSP